uniref:Peptidase aspartic putative domain-containing protein n=1 Tax=Panagrolaimus sp. ES5 TaxID=591445 RepID=A0AC34GZ89_9BILA
MDTLIGLLEGVALEEVAGFEIAEENYDTVVNTLKDRFGNDTIVQSELYSNLRSIPPATSNAKSIRDTVNLISNMCRQLQNYGIDINNNALQTEIIDKMPPREKNDLSWFQIKNPNTATDIILEKMKDVALKAEISLKNFTKASSYPQQTYIKVSTTNIQTLIPADKSSSNNSTNDTENNPSKRFACTLCGDDHWTANCPKFITPEDKIHHLELNNCCTKCARRHHVANQCHANVSCRLCNGNHYNFLCQSKRNTTFQEANSSNTFVSLGAQQSCLLTKRVTVINPVTNKIVDATVLFDAGSQRSFVSDNLIRQLKLPRGAKEKLNLQGTGAKATSYTSTMVKLRIKTTENFEDIDANSMPIIANSVSLINFEENDPSNNTVTEETPDILIGMDYFFTFITSFEKRNNFVIVHSKIGQMLSDKIGSSKNTTFSSLAIEQRVYKNDERKNKAMGYMKNDKEKTGTPDIQKFTKSTKPETKTKTFSTITQ